MYSNRNVKFLFHIEINKDKECTVKRTDRNEMDW